MKIKKLMMTIGFIAVAGQVNAQTNALVNKQQPDELISQKIKAMYPNTAISKVRPSVITGLYEVEMGQNIAYTDSAGRYFVFGRLYDMKQQIDLTAQHQQSQQVDQRVAYPSAYLNNAIKTVKGNGQRQLIVFSDPNCPYCQHLEKELASLDNVTIYTFLYPVLGEDSAALSASVWCAPDKETAWGDFMLKQIRPAFASCLTPVNDNMALGSQLGIAATPTLIAKDGRILRGATSAEKLNAWLGNAQ